MAAERTAERFEPIESRYKNEAEVNGIIIDAHYDIGYMDYVLYFPQIDMNEAIAKGTGDQLFRIGESPEIAKKVFDYAVKLAETESDVYEVFKKAEKFAKTIRKDS